MSHFKFEQGKLFSLFAFASLLPLYFCGRRGSQMVSVPDPGSSGPGSSPGWSLRCVPL